MAHAMCHFFDLHVNHHSQIAAQALYYIAKLYETEHELKNLRADVQQQTAGPV